MLFQYGNQTLDFCVLSLLEDKDSYGYEITQRITKYIDISESTMYPVLRRLKKGGFLETYDKPFQGRNRRYYSLTKDGRKLLEDFRSDWEIYKENIDKISRGDKKWLEKNF